MPSPPQADRRLDELAAIHRSLRALTSTLELPAILRTVLDSIKVFTAAEGLSLLLHDAERDELVFAASETLRESALAGEPEATEPACLVARSGVSVLATDGHVLTVPIRRGETSVGAIELRGHYEGRPFGPADRARLEEVAASLAAEADAERLSHDGPALHRLFTHIAAAVPSQAASLVLHDGAGRPLSFSASRSLEPGVIDGVRLRVGEGIAGWVARHREPVRLDDAAHDPRHQPALAGQTGLAPRSMLCVPVVKNDVFLGVIQVINKLDGSSFTDDELRLVLTLADHAAIAIENARLYREARTAAITDDLTGLSNTRHFNAMLPVFLAAGGPVTLLVLDLDNFKAVVDTHGHLIGSRTIAFVGGLIARRLRPGDFAARFGGDEFVVVLPATDRAAGIELAESIRTAIADARVLEGTDVDISAVTASVGLAIFPEHATAGEALFRAADAAMYQVKRDRKNGVLVAG